MPAEHAIRGFHGVSLLLEDAAPTAAILTDVLGFVAGEREDAVQRYRAPGARLGAIVDLRSPAISLGPPGRRLGASHRLPRG